MIKKNLFVFVVGLFILLSPLFVLQTKASYVDGYYKSNGTYVEGYYRSRPNAYAYDNYSYTGPTYSNGYGYNDSYYSSSYDYDSNWYTPSFNDTNWSYENDVSDYIVRAKQIPVV